MPSFVICTQLNYQIYFLNVGDKINDKFDFKLLYKLKTKPKIGLPQCFLNFKLYLIEKLWGAFVSKNVRLKSSGPWTSIHDTNF